MILNFQNSDPRSINVPMRRHHSTDGVAQGGYNGSGPADTALSILAALYPFQGLASLDELHQRLGMPTDPEDQERALERLDQLPHAEREREDARYDEAYRKFEAQRPVKLWDGHFVSPQVWAWHQAFKRAALLHLPEGHWQLDSEEIRDWVTRGANENDLLHWRPVP